MRRPKALMPTPNTPCTKSKLLVFDIETIRWTEPYALGMFDGKTCQIFEGHECIHDFLNEFLQKKYRGFIAYAHNGGKFDFNFILKQLFSKRYIGKYTIEPLRIGSRVTQLTIRDRRKHIWVLRDSFAMLDFSLKDMAAKFEVSTQKGEFDHTKINWSNWLKLRPEWQPYLVSDCKALYEVLDKYEDYLIGKFNVSLRQSMTRAQLALQIYRKDYLPHPIPTYTAVEADVRKAFYGGRTEIFKQYGEDMNYYDVNSLYPYVMAKFPMPVGTPLKSYAMKTEDFGVAYCEIDCPGSVDIPILPYRKKTKQGYKLVFPTGQFKGWYCTPELKRAEEVGYKIKILYGYKFKQSYIFKKYIEDMYLIKQQAKKDSIDYLNSKLLMNSLYGKFGQRREKQQIVIFPKSSIGLEPYDVFGEIPIYIKRIESESTHILPAIAAFVTSYARLHLFNIMQGCDPYYCDTDSIITKKKLPTGDKLGELKLEMEIKEGVFILPKMYGVIKSDGKEFVKAKGFPKNTFTYLMMKEALFSNDYTKLHYSKEKFASPFESMRRNKTFVSLLNLTRSVITRYDKRIVVDKSKTTALNVCDTEN